MVLGTVLGGETETNPTTDSVAPRWLERMDMRFCIESKYSSLEDGVYRKISTANSTDELLLQLRNDMARPGWSDSVLVKTEALPKPATEDWGERVASKTRG